jgi:hypothetical protein
MKIRTIKIGNQWQKKIWPKPKIEEFKLKRFFFKLKENQNLQFFVYIKDLGTMILLKNKELSKLVQTTWGPHAYHYLLTKKP